MMKKVKSRSCCFTDWKMFVSLLAVCSIGAIKINYFTPDQFRSESIIKSDFKAEPPGFTPGKIFSSNDRPADPLVIEKIARAVCNKNLNVEYYSKELSGKKEFHTKSPVSVEFSIKNQNFYCQDFELIASGNDEFKLYFEYNGINRIRTGRFGFPIHEAEIIFTVHKSDADAPWQGLEGKIGFTVFSDRALASKIAADYVNIFRSKQGLFVSATTTSPEKSLLLAQCISEELALNDNHTLMAKINVQLTETANELGAAYQNSTMSTFFSADEDASSAISREMAKELIKTKNELLLQQLALNNLSDYMRQNRISGNAVPEFGTITDPVFSNYIIRLNEKIAERSLLGKQEATMLDSEIEFLKSTLAEGIRNTRKKAALQMEEVSRQLAAIEKQQEESGMPGPFLSRNPDLRLAERKLDFLLDKKLEIAYNDFINKESAVIVRAQLPASPINPDKAKVWILLIGAGLIAGFAVSGLKVWFNRKRKLIAAKNSYYSSLRTIGEITTDVQSQAQETQNICSALLMMQSGSKKRIITISSMKQGAGKEYVIAELAKAFAAYDLKVLLINMDHKNSELESGFSVKGDYSLADVFNNKKLLHECICITPFPTIDFISGGGHIIDMNRLLANRKIEMTLAELREHYDFVLINSESISENPSWLALFSQSDTGIMMIASHDDRSEIEMQARLYNEISGLNNLYFIADSSSEKLNKTKGTPAVHSSRTSTDPELPEPSFLKRAALWMW